MGKNTMWNYRIIKNKDNSYGLYEVIYNDDGKISAHSENAELYGESPKDILETLRLMLDDANKSYYNILEWDKIKFAPLCEEFDEGEIIDARDLLNDTILTDPLNHPKNKKNT
jgi:hypothetical protein